MWNHGKTQDLVGWIYASEGQRCYDTLINNHAGNIGNYVAELQHKNLKEGYIIIDGADSGVSIDLLLSLRYFFNLVLDDCTKSNIDLYLIITSNSYELVYGYDCIWIPTMEHYKRNDEADEYNLWRKLYEDYYKEVNNKE